MNNHAVDVVSKVLSVDQARNVVRALTDAGLLRPESRERFYAGQSTFLGPGQWFIYDRTNKCFNNIGPFTETDAKRWTVFWNKLAKEPR